jgi:sugar phosphate isomerase/epimerase
VKGEEHAVGIALGVDTLSYHCRLEGGEISLEQVLEEASELGAEFVQLNAYHLRTRDPGGLEGLRRRADQAHLGLTLSGDVVGRAAQGDAPGAGADRVVRWVELAERLASPFVRVSSGFYRNEMLGRPEAIAAEQRFLVEALRLAVDRAEAAGVSVLLENHSDFTPEEYVEIIDQVGVGRIGVFLDIINPVSMLLDPLPVVRQLSPWALAGHAKDYRLVSNYVEDGFHRRGFDVQYCYPGEGVADLRGLITALVSGQSRTSYHLSIEGLDNHPGVADQRERLAPALALLRRLITDAGEAGPGAELHPAGAAGSVRGRPEAG